MHGVVEKLKLNIFSLDICKLSASTVCSSVGQLVLYLVVCLAEFTVSEFWETVKMMKNQVLTRIGFCCI